MARKIQSARSTGRTILVVDDSLEYLEATRLTLEREGHRVLTCAAGREALDLLRQEHVDLVLLDYFMPGMTGEDVVNELRQFDPHVQVVLQTGYASERPPRELLRRLDIQGFHDKSEGPDKLLLWTDVGLKSAHAVQLLNKSRQGLRYILDVTPDLHRIQPLEELLQGVLLQVAGLLGAPNSFIAVLPAKSGPEGGPREGFLAVVEGPELVIRASTGRFRIQDRLEASLDESRLGRVKDSVRRGAIDVGQDATIVPLQVGGTVIGVVYLDRAAPSDVDAEIVGLMASQAALAIQNAHLYEMATVDPLTGMYLRPFLENWLSREMRTAYRSQQPLSVVMLALDGFETINEAAGPSAGKEALALVGRMLRETIRGSDIAVRHGDDELTLVLPGTDLDGAAALCDRIVRALEGASVAGPSGSLPVRVSLGFATLQPAPGDIEHVRSRQQAYFMAMGRALLASADQGVFFAKQAGGHCARSGAAVESGAARVA